MPDPTYKVAPIQAIRIVRRVGTTSTAPSNTRPTGLNGQVWPRYSKNNT